MHRLLLAALAALIASSSASGAPSSTTTVPIRLSGGHVTDPRDHGRPVRLVAAGLGVPTAVFRKAFSGVTPAGAGDTPDPDQVLKNKAALLKVLAPYGVTNDDLDRVSNSYRYVESEGQTWPEHAAHGTATIRDGRVVSVSVSVSVPGSGYTTAPRVTVPGHAGARLKASLSFGKDLTANGSVRKVAVVAG